MPLRTRQLAHRIGEIRDIMAQLTVSAFAGIIGRRFYAQHPPRAEYALTARGRELGPVMQALRDWGNKRKD